MRRGRSAREARTVRWVVMALLAVTGAAFVVPLALALLPTAWVGTWSDAAYSRLVLAVAALACVAVAYRTRRGRRSG
ncbi:hypothetical protein ACFQLX_24305 [Streptomyces polyrhachis]|uniref:Uncharacterized protein n=1 Tax=Streptomyces polyrhachis TaxID=1282885 RepID=A0ABW2GKH5_9ACTN